MPRTNPFGLYKEVLFDDERPEVDPDDRDSQDGKVDEDEEDEVYAATPADLEIHGGPRYEREEYEE